MSKVIGVKFHKNPKIYYFLAGDYEFTKNCGVVVETNKGLECGEVVVLPSEDTFNEPRGEETPSPRVPIVRLASAEDIAKNIELRETAKASKKTTAEKIRKYKLDMKLVDVEYTLDSAKLIVYYVAENRVDFRDIVRELASTFRMRIEMRQIGNRDECRMLGGLGPCGKECCCSHCLADYPHTSVKMAKNQSLSLNPTKISGLCGRLMCCLAFENEHYVEINKKCPKIGGAITLSSGVKGVLHSINHLHGTVTVRVPSGDTVELVNAPIEEIVPNVKVQSGQ